MVIPAYNAAATLAEQLEALAEQDYEGDWEVLVVDNGSSDATADIARRYAGRLPACTVVEGRRRGHAAPRNDGARAARGELLAYCDADDVVARGWLKALAAAARRYDLVGGWLDPEPLNDEATRSWHGAYPKDGLRSWLLPYSGQATSLSGPRCCATWAAGRAIRVGRGGRGVVLAGPGSRLPARLRPRRRRPRPLPAELWPTARQAWTIGINSERLLRDFGFVRELDLPAGWRPSTRSTTAWRSRARPGARGVARDQGALPARPTPTARPVDLGRRPVRRAAARRAQLPGAGPATQGAGPGRERKGAGERPAAK